MIGMKDYLNSVDQAEKLLAEAFDTVAQRQRNEFEVWEHCARFAEWCRDHQRRLEPFLSQYGRKKVPGPRQLRAGLFKGARTGGLGVLRDLQDLSLLATAVRTHYTLIQEAAVALHDPNLEAACKTIGQQTDRQINWLCALAKNLAPQALAVPPNRLSETKASVPRASIPARPAA